MRIVAVHEKTVSLASSSRNASASFRAMTASVLALETDAMRNGKKLYGLAFDSLGRYAHGTLLRERFIPRLLAADPTEYTAGDSIDPRRIRAIVMSDEKPGGHGERAGAVGLLDAAAWDLAAKVVDQPLWFHLASDTREQTSSPRVPVYATGGYYRDDRNLQPLREELERYLDLGFTRVKIKVGGASLAEDRARIEAALEVLGSGVKLAVDCNGTLGREGAFALVDALAPYGLAWIEEPVDPLDFDLYREVAARSDTPIATGENLFSLADARNLVRHGGLRRDRDLLQFDISLGYGLVEYLRILEMLEAHDWSRSQCLPHGGHLISLHAAAALGLAGHETAPLASYAPHLEVEEGFTSPGDAPGAGFERHPRLISLFSGLVA